MLALIRRYSRIISIFFLINILSGIFTPHAVALTSGPSQPEAQQFAPAGMDNMVDPFTGDFSYNIPLLDVGGYPININYSAGITQDQEASWVGLGWNLNVGAINRSVRGIPDDFAGEEIVTHRKIKPNQTFGLTYQKSTKEIGELFTFKLNLAQNYNIFYNTYNGFGYSISHSPSFDVPLLASKSDSKFKLGVDLVPSLSFNMGSEDGAGITPSVGLKIQGERNENEATLNSTISFPYSSRQGARGMSMASSFSYTTAPKTVTRKDADGKEWSTVNQRSGGFGANSFLGFAMPTYTPFVKANTYSVNATFQISPEKLNLPNDKTRIVLGGFYQGQFQESNQESNPAFGYMYEGLSSSDRSVLDFNREKDGGYNEKTSNLPVTNHTYDIFSVQGEGVGGTYRLFRSDVGIVGDNIHTDTDISPDLAISGGFTAKDKVTFKDVKIGVDFKYIQGNISAGRWTSPHIQSFMSPLVQANTKDERVYFGKIGDAAPENNSDFFNNTLLSDQKYAYKLSAGYATGQIVNGEGESSFLRKNNQTGYLRTTRKNRNTSFNILTASQASQFTSKNIYSYNHANFSVSAPSSTQERRNQPVSYEKSLVSRVDDERKGHHISEVQVTNNSGSRYVYGVPVYNKSQTEVSFSVDPTGQNIDVIRQEGVVIYDPADASLSNNKGLDEYFNKVVTKGSASSYLLTYILSPDYVDSDNIEGPSDGDLGTYVKFNYGRTSTDYKWRTPYALNTGTFADGLAGKRTDDKASYTYGVKELWYLHSIETRTHVAEFYVSSRADGIGVQGEHGGMPGTISENDKLKQLDRIVLYAKPDKINAYPETLKTVHFTYDYSLCPETPNSNSQPTIECPVNKGKLTLKKVHFTYGLSNKSILNPYTFDYADTNFDGVVDVNFPYNSKNYDRWGLYKEQLSVRNEVFPYTNQTKSLTDQYAAAYALTKINTPTGGEMRVHYESDDYGYVQNQQAMRMFTIRGVSSSSDPNSFSTNLYANPTSNLDGKMFLHIDLNEGFSSTDAENYFRNNYLGNLSQLHYRVKLNAFGSTEEYISGYFDINSNVAVYGNNLDMPNYYNTAVIEVVPERLNRTGAAMHPFIKSGWLYARLHYNRELVGSADASGSAVMQVLGSIKSATAGVLNMIFGFRLMMKGAGHSNTITPSESFVRLYEHDKKKLGGGHRVKAIVMLDRWDQMLSDRETNQPVGKEPGAYGQVYTYTKNEDPSNPESRIISSGVAAYEPFLGGEENPFRQMHRTTERVPLAPDKEYYTETPFGESFFPSPVVGYSKVVVTPVKVLNASYNVNSLSSNGTGFVEQEFYTAYDFPTFVSHTDIDHYREKSSKLNPLKIASSDFVSCAQGYLIELNDMHGKPKSTKVMPDQSSGSANPISFVKYEYKVQNGNPDKLNCSVPLVSQNLQITNNSGNELGTTVDVVHDTRSYSSVFSGGGADINVKLSFPPPFPVPPVFVPVISVFPDVNYERVKFTSLATTKVVNRYGVLVKTIALDNGQTITTENLLWDNKTGDVLLTKVQNEFHDPVYGFTYPGHWAYAAMGLASQNEGFYFTSLTGRDNDLITGDEVICMLGSGNVIHAYYKSPGLLIDKQGAVHTSIQWGQVVRSGARNVAMTPVGTVTCLDYPVNGNSVNFSNVRILNAGSSEYKNIWKGFCNCGEQSSSANNPFTTGQEGQLRPWKSWTYLTERSQSLVNGQVNVKVEGAFIDFSNFWVPGTKFMSPYYYNSTNSSKWQWVTEVQNYNPLGMEIENKDVLDRYSMAQFGYGRNLPVATSNNSQYQETGFDGFEDYDYGDCNDDHFSWRSRNVTNSPSVVSEESHTGRKSFKVGPNSSSRIVKIIDPCNNNQ